MITITGATGYLGGHSARALLEAGTDPSGIRILARDLEKAEEFRSAGCELVYADYDKPDTLVPALEGADLLYFVSGSSRDDAQRVRQHSAVLDAIQSAGVGHVVYTSFVDAHTPSPFHGAEVHKLTERRLFEGDVRWTILRNGAYADYVPMTSGIALKRGELASPNSAGHVSYVTRDDIVRASVAVLRDPSAHAGKVYVLTGPQALSQEDLAGILSRVSGREIPYRHIGYDEYAGLMAKEMGMPEEAARSFLSMNYTIEQGRMAYISDDIELLTGTPATRLEDYLSKTGLQPPGR